MPSTTRSSAKAKKASASSAPPAPSSEEHLLALAARLHHLCISGTLDQIKRLFELGAPGWYQEETMGWSCLHYAADRGDWRIVKCCLENGAVWNAADLLGRTAGDIALSQNDEKSYMLIRNEGIRQEMIHHALQASKEPSDPIPSSSALQTEPSTSMGVGNETEEISHDETTNTYTLKGVDNTSAGDNFAFLKSKLTWTTGDDGKERVLDEDGNGVMMGWEEPLMIAHTKLVKSALKEKIERGEGLSVLNIGFGLGIIDTLLQNELHPTRHTIIEAHPSVLTHIQSTPFHNNPNVSVLEGRWQDWCTGEKLGELVGKSEGGAGYDFVFIDTFAEGYEELKAFFEIIPDLLEGPESVFSFWNGLGATNPLIYDVACNLAEMHMDDVGLATEWHDVVVDNATAEETWKGVRRLYWTLPVYKLPIAKYSMKNTHRTHDQPTKDLKLSSLAQTAQSAVELGALAVLSTPVIRAVFGTSDKKASVAETHQTFDTDPEVHLAHSAAVSSTPVIQEDQEEKEEESTSIPPTPKIETEEETKSLPPTTPAPVEQEQERKFTPDPSAKTVELAPALALDSLPPVGRTTHTYPTPNFTHLHASNAGKQQEDDTTSSVSAYTSESRRNSSSDLKTLPTVVASSAQVDEGVIPKSETTPSTPNQENNHNSNEMGIFSAFSGNIAAPDKRKSISRSNTAKTTGTTATTEPLVGATGDRNVAVPAQGVDATYNENNTATVEPTTATTDGVSERAVSPAPRTPATVAKSFVATERPSYEETRDPVVAPNGIESGVPVTEEVEGKYEGATTNGYPARPSYNDDQPSRSYIKTNRNDATPSVRNIALPVTEEEIIQRAPAVLERDADGNPTRIDTTIASPANMGDREHLGGVITLPAGGALLPGGMAYADKEPHTAETVDESDIATERAPTERAPTERAVSQRAPSVRSRETKEERPVTPVVVEEHKAPTTIAPSVYTQHEEPKVRDLMHEGQAYRQDGSVPGQPQQQQYQDQTFSSAPVLNEYAPIGGATAGGAMSHGNAVNYEQQQHNQNQQQQRFSGPPQTQQFIQQQQPQQYRNDPSFAAERAMSPGPEMGMNRLTIAEPMRNGQSQVGPSPGPPIAPFQPTATPVSPTKSVGSNGLDRSNTYRTGVSRGNTISRRGGAFANGSALSGGGVAEAYGREDIHNRNDLATRNLIAAGKPGAAVSRKISSAEKKDAKRMSKLIVNEGKTEAAAVRGAMKELEQLQKVQKAAAIDELKAQKAQTKALQVHDKAYKKFLKHKEVYDRIEADLRSREEQYEATRQHAQAQTEILAQKNAELNDLRAQKAADDREREMRLLALKNPGAA